MLNLVHVTGEELVDLPLEAVELLDRLLEDVADHQLGAIIGVELEGRVKHLVEAVNLGLSLTIEEYEVEVGKK